MKSGQQNKYRKADLYIRMRDALPNAQLCITQMFQYYDTSECNIMCCSFLSLAMAVGRISNLCFFLLFCVTPNEIFVCIPTPGWSVWLDTVHVWVLLLPYCVRLQYKRLVSKCSQWQLDGCIVCYLAPEAITTTFCCRFYAMTDSAQTYKTQCDKKETTR